MSLQSLQDLFRAALLHNFRGIMRAPKVRGKRNPPGSKLAKRFKKGMHVRGY